MILSGNENFSVFRPSTGQNSEIIKPTTLSVAGLTFTPDLTTSTISTGSGAVGPTTFISDLNGAAFEATLDTLHLLGAIAGTVAVTLPTPVLGAAIKFVVMEDILDGTRWELNSVATFAVGSYLQMSWTVTTAPKGRVCAPNHTWKTVRIIGTTNGGGGKGGTVNFYGVQEDDGVKWLVSGSLCTQGTGTVADGSVFV
jgi:hypothetical protein